MPLTLRPATLSHHASQVSFPGGSIEVDESPEDAAWRELHEELGIGRDLLEPLGRLTPLYIFASNLHVIPCVAFAQEPPHFVPSVEEVEAVLELPLTQLPGAVLQHRQVIERGELRFRAPYWQVGLQKVCGASAMILGELAAILAEIRC